MVTVERLLLAIGHSWHSSSWSMSELFESQPHIVSEWKPMEKADIQPVTNTLAERQFREAADILQQRGIDISTMPSSVSKQRIVELVFTGSLGKIPRSFDLGRVINYLQTRKRFVALWAIENYPDNVKLLHCKRGKYKLQFILPPLAVKSQRVTQV